MVPCILIGDTVTFNLAHARPACAAVAVQGISSAAFVASDLSHLVPAKTAVISLGANDAPSTETAASMQKLRQAVIAQKVVWLIPNASPAVRLAVTSVASQWHDGVVDIRTPEAAKPATAQATSAQKPAPVAAEVAAAQKAGHDASPTDAEAALLACGSSVEPSTLRAIMHVESGGRVFAVNVNGVQYQPPPAATVAGATAEAESWIARGYNVDLGLMQVNNSNLASLGFTVAQMFDPCVNIQAGASILTADYLAAATGRPDPQDALKAALSAYNTGNFERGFYNGYVAKYYGPGARTGGMPVISAAAYHTHWIAPALPPNPFTASPNVFSREASND